MSGLTTGKGIRSLQRFRESVLTTAKRVGKFGKSVLTTAKRVKRPVEV